MGNKILIPKYKIGQDVFAYDTVEGFIATRVVDFVRSSKKEVRYMLSKTFVVAFDGLNIKTLGSRKKAKVKIKHKLISNTITIEANPCPENRIFKPEQTVVIGGVEVFFTNEMAYRVKKGLKIR